jgi:hypothetical protein
MERNGRSAAASTVSFRTLVPLTSHEEDERYWYDPGDRIAGSLAWGARVCEVDSFGCNEEGVDIGWSCARLRSGH